MATVKRSALIRRKLALWPSMALVLAALSGCVPGPFLSTSTESGGVETEYTGLHENFARACVAIAANAELRDDEGVPSWIKVSDIDAVQRIEESEALYDVSGRTYVSFANKSQPTIYEWTCVASTSPAGDLLELNARLTTFERIKDE